MKLLLLKVSNSVKSTKYGENKEGSLITLWSTYEQPYSALTGEKHTRVLSILFIGFCSDFFYMKGRKTPHSKIYSLADVDRTEQQFAEGFALLL
jgi:hypothetical protein